jgi:hypothetical protein
MNDFETIRVKSRQNLKQWAMDTEDHFTIQIIEK